MRCPTCGSEVQAGLTMCPWCGATVRHVRLAGGKLRCRSCQRRVPSGLTVCPYCGARLQRSWQRPLQALLMLAVLAALAYLGMTYLPRYKAQLEQAWADVQALRGRIPAPEVAFLVTPTFTATPTATATATPTVTPTPTYTATSVPPTETQLPPTLTPTRQVTRAPTPTPTPPFVAPRLVSPEDGVEIRGGGAQIILRWEQAGTLGEDEWYALSLRFMAGGIPQYGGTWTKETSWVVPKELYMKAGQSERAFEWDVTVMKQTGTKADGGREGVAVSAPSETRAFFWY
jgi:hypothetical protein